VDLTDTLCWSCNAPATRLAPNREPRCTTCPDDYSAAQATPEPSDMAASENYGPERRLVLIGKIGPRFGVTRIEVRTNGRRRTLHGSPQGLRMVLRSAEADYIEALETA
jgi:hypothetical protein